MLKDDFYRINSLHSDGDSYTIMLTLEKEHAILKGHFPGQPVVPGACLVQMVKEITETVLGKKILLGKGDSIKFLNPIDPNENNDLQMSIRIAEAEGLGKDIAAIVSSGATVYFKFNGSCSFRYSQP